MSNTLPMPVLLVLFLITLSNRPDSSGVKYDPSRPSILWAAKTNRRTSYTAFSPPMSGNSCR
jgi:hypothetical protein